MVIRQDDFTEQAQQALSESQQMVVQMRHSQWDVEHLLSGLLQIDNSLSAKMLEVLGVDVADLLQELDGRLKQSPTVGGSSGPSQIYPTPRVQTAIETAKKEVIYALRRLWHDIILTEEEIEQRGTVEQALQAKLKDAKRKHAEKLPPILQCAQYRIGAV